MAQISLKSLMNNSAPTYSEEIQPFRQELTETNFKQLLTPADVENALNKKDEKISPCRIEFCLRLCSPRSKTRCDFFFIE